MNFRPESVQLARRGVRRLLSTVSRLRGHEAPWITRQRAVDRAFDAQHGVRTGGIVQLNDLCISAPYDYRRLAVPYVASDPVVLRRALRSLPVRQEDFTFIDLGSGKGRALMVAAERPFRRIIGVEFAVELHRDAQRNLSVVNAREGKNRVELHHGDVLYYPLPAEPLVLYLYNPFGAEIMRAVVDRVRRSLEREPREIYVIYNNPFHLDVWTDSGFMEVAGDDEFAILRAPDLRQSRHRP